MVYIINRSGKKCNLKLRIANIAPGWLEKYGDQMATVSDVTKRRVRRQFFDARGCQGDTGILMEMIEFDENGNIFAQKSDRGAVDEPVRMAVNGYLQ